MPGAAEYARLTSLGRCPQCGSAVTDHQPNGERYAYCSDCRKARREERAASREPAKRPPAAPNPKKRSFPKRVRIEIAERDGWRCHYCGAELMSDRTREWRIDHRVPVSRGGSDDPGNLVLACELDNQRKGDLTEPEYRDWLAGYGADLPDLDQTAWARIGIVRARAAGASCRVPGSSNRSFTVRDLSSPRERGAARGTFQGLVRWLPDSRTGCELEQ